MSKSLKLIIESLLFSSEKPLTVKDIKDCVPDTDTKEIKSALAVLEHDYEAMDRSYDLKEVAGGYQFRSKPEYGSYILRMLQSTPNRLSRAAMETLAIVAYKQPILRHEVEKLRGVDVGGILKTLLEKDLIKIMGRKDLPGKPLIYGTTKRFLEVFDLKDISDLPKMNEIKDFGLAGYEPTPQNQDTPLEPQGTEGLSAGPDSEQAAETQEDTQAQDTGEAQGEPMQAQESSLEEEPGDIQIQEPVSDEAADMQDEYQETGPDEEPEQPMDLEPAPDEMPDVVEEEYQETGPEEMSGEPEEYYHDASPDDMPDEREFFHEDGEAQEGYNDMNGESYPDDDPSGDGNQDDTED